MNNLRKHHALMENERSDSYAIMADSIEYRPAYTPYIKIIDEYISKKQNIKILNIGAATGILESLILEKYPSVKIFSIDNSVSFKQKFEKQNHKWIEKGAIQFIFSDIQNYPFDEKFDIIISRDLNHHLELHEIESYINKAFSSLNEDGILIIEDVRKDADKEGIYSFIDIAFQIPAFENDKNNRYFKIVGIVESFGVSYLSSDIKAILDSSNIKYESYVSDARYIFKVYKL